MSRCLQRRSVREREKSFEAGLPGWFWKRGDTRLPGRLHVPPQSDNLSVTSNNHIEEKKTTKRIVLQTLSQIYDPLGYVTPLTVEGKVFLQELWTRKAGWDEILTEKESKRWKEIKTGMDGFSNISIERFVGTQIQQLFQR